MARPHPEWTVKRLGDLLYSAGGVGAGTWASWSGSAGELAEAMALPELARIEWKDEMAKL